MNDREHELQSKRWLEPMRKILIVDADAVCCHFSTLHHGLQISAICNITTSIVNRQSDYHDCLHKGFVCAREGIADVIYQPTLSIAYFALCDEWVVIFALMHAGFWNVRGCNSVEGHQEHSPRQCSACQRPRRFRHPEARGARDDARRPH